MPMRDTSQKIKPCGSGRKKIEIKKIDNTCRRRVAFSKRRRGLFNKASELCRICDANISIIIFSPTGRMYTFGHPSPDHVIDRFLNEDDNKNEQTQDDDCSMEPKEEEESSETSEEGTSESSESSETVGEEGFWWEESIEGLSIEELEKYKGSLQELRKNVAMKLKEVMRRRNCEKDFVGFI